MIKYNFCPQCKRRLANSEEFVECKFCKIRIYKNSKPTAEILIINDGKVLLSKRGIDPYKNKYDIVGGFLNNGEPPDKGIHREVLEETGLKTKIVQLLGIYIDKYGKDGDYTFNCCYVGKIVSGKIKASDDVKSLHWFPITKLPAMAFFHQKKALLDLKKWWQNENGD